MAFHENKNAPFQIFISYRREGGEALAHLLYDRLTQKKFRVFLDVESLRAGKFNDALYKKIEECDDFLLVLPENCLARCVDPDDWLRLEIEHALKCKKNIVPIMMRNFKFPNFLPPTMEDLRNYNGVAASMNLFDAVMEKIIGMLVSKPEEPFPFKKILALLSVTILLFVGAMVYSLISGTTQSPQGGTTQSPQGGTTQSPQGGTTQSPQGGTAQSPQGGTTQSPQGGTAQSSQSRTVQSSQSRTAQSSQSGTVQSSQITISNSTINASNTTIKGSNNEITGNNNKIVGSNNEIRGNNNVVVGSNNYSYGQNNSSNGANNHEYE